MAALRSGDRQPLMDATPALLNARGPEGSTPFMYAALYTDAATLETLLQRGADPNARNDAGATPLIWAATDAGKTRVLVNHGADVNAQSATLRTPLMVAATRPGNAAAVTLLLDRGANPNPTPQPMGQSSPLIQAATAGDADMMRLLIDRGADVAASAGPALAMALTVECATCADLLYARDLGRDAYTFALLQTAYLASLKDLRLMLDRGADVNALDPLGRSPLMYAAVSDFLPLEQVKVLIARGADVNATDRHVQSGDAGLSVLDIARTHGDTPIVAELLKAGAKGTPRPAPALKPMRASSPRAAVERTLPLLQKADATFTARSGCFSCHNNSLAAMAVAQARTTGTPVDERIATQQVAANLAAFAALREGMHEGFFTPVEDFFAPSVLGYALIGLHAEHHAADLDTDAAAMYIRMHQMADGHWAYGAADLRPPLCSDYVGQTALAMRGLQLYPPATDQAGAADAVRRAGAWLATVKSRSTDDWGWRLIGLAWAGRTEDVPTAMKELLAAQRSDGGWSDLDSMASTAYATGKALVALQTAGLPASDPAYQRAVRFLLETQQADGSWYVPTRALAIQPYFENGFPHGTDQWISAAASSWATLALAAAPAN